MSPRHEPASVHELTRVGLLAGLPGEQLVKLAGLRDQGALSDSEFELAKQKLLSGNGASDGVTV